LNGLPAAIDAAPATLAGAADRLWTVSDFVTDWRTPRMSNSTAWKISDTLIVAILAAVGIAVALAIGAFHQQALSLGMWVRFHVVEAIPWAVVGLIVGGGLGCVWRLSSK
jgi:hypothetical protein